MGLIHSFTHQNLTSTSHVAGTILDTKNTVVIRQTLSLHGISFYTDKQTINELVYNTVSGSDKCKGNIHLKLV